MAFDAPFPQSDEQVAKQTDDLKNFAEGQAAPQPSTPAAPAPATQPTAFSTGTEVANTVAPDRSFKGIGEIKTLPSAKDVQTLRANQSDPDLIHAFNSMYGNEAAARYLNFPQKSDVDKLLAHRDDPEMVSAFDRLYGDISKYIVPLYDPNSIWHDRMANAAQLEHILQNGKGWFDTASESTAGEMAGSVVHGAKAGVTELARSAASGIDAATGSNLEASVPSSEDTRLLNHPVVAGIVSGISQFVTGNAIIAAATGGLGGASTIANTIRNLSNFSLTSAFAFNPHDPMLGDLAKSLGMGDNWFTKLDSIETYKTEAMQRLAHGAEGGVIGASFDILGGLWKAVKAARAGDTAAADAAKNKVADIIEQHQLELPLGDNAKSQVEPTFANKGLMELPEQTAPAKPTAPTNFFDQYKLDPNSGKFTDKWGHDHQISFDLTQPEKGPRLYSGDSGAQGDLFPMQAVTKEDLAKAGEKPAFAQIDDPNAPPKTYSKAELEGTSREQFVKDQLDENAPIERQVKQQIEEPPAPRLEVPSTVRDLLDNIPDFKNFSLQHIRETIAPVFDHFLDIANKSPLELEQVMHSDLHPQDVMKIQALTSTAVKSAEDAAAEAGAKLDALKKAKVTDAGEISDLVKQRNDAHDLLAKLQKLDYPLGTYAGRLLQQRQIEQRLTMANKVNVNELRKAGVSEERINDMLRTALDQVDTTRLSELNAERLNAVRAGDIDKVKELDGLIKNEMRAVDKAAKSKAMSLTRKIVQDAASYSVASVISGIGTAVRVAFGILAHVGLIRLNQAVGLMREQGLMQGMRTYAMEVQARNIALRAGHTSYLNTLASVLKDSAVATLKNDSKTQMKSMAEAFQNRRISAAKYGLTGKAATALNWFGKGVDALTLPIRFTDELSSEIFARHAIGTRSAFNFSDALQNQRSLAEAKLRDPKLSAADRATVETELASLKGKDAAPVIDGKKTTLKDYVTDQVDKSYDANGKLTNQNAIDDSNYLLLHNRQTDTAMFGIPKALEKFASSHPAIKFIIPVFNAPMNGFKRGMETIPGLRLLTSDIRSELNSTDPYIRSMAKGKVFTAYGMFGTSLLLADQGYVTYEPEVEKNARISAQSSSSVGPNVLKIGGASFDLPGMEPVAIPLIWSALFVNKIKQYNQALQQKADAQTADPNAEPISMMEQRLDQLLNVGMAVMGATAQAISKNPAVSGPREIVAMLINLANSTETADNKSGKIWEEAARSQIGKLIPNTYRQMIGLFDNNRYDPASLMDMLLTTAGVTQHVAERYDVMGRPMINKEPLRSLLGPLSPVNPPDKNSKAQYVIDTLDAFGKATGHYYVFSTTPPDSLLQKAGVDLRTFQSMTGDRKVQDEFAKQYRSVEINGRTIDEQLYNMLTTGDQRQRTVGNQLVDGTLWNKVTETINQYKKVAWELTLRNEMTGGNTDLRTAVNNAYAQKKAASNPLFDLPQPDAQQTRTREMINLFPPR
jgi:hypothetical protein